MQYIYKKYNSDSTTTWSWREYNNSTYRAYVLDTKSVQNWHRGVTLWSSYKLDSPSGDISPSGREVVASSATQGNTAYYITSSKRNMYRGTIEYNSDNRGWELFANRQYLPLRVTYNEKGTYRGNVTSADSSAYPIDGQQGDYWYDTRTSETSYSRGDYIEEVTAEDGAFPNNGRHTDGYWYVKDRAANQAPTISGKDEDLGTVTGPFTKTFSVDDLDLNQELTVDVKLNGFTIRTINNATRKETYSINITQEMYDDLELNVTNTIAITVSDTAGTSAVRRWTFKRVNTNPTIEVQNSNLGQQNNPFSFKFTPNDADGDSISAKIFLDDVQIEDLGNVTRGQERTYSIGKIDFARIKNGNHKIKIEVTDSNNAKGYGYIDFSKNIAHAWYKFHRELTAQPAEITVQAMLELAEGAELTIKVCNNALDTNPTWEEIPDVLIGQVYTFTNMTKTNENWAIGVEVRIDRGTATKDSYFYGFVGAYR